jgi:cobalt/nickel transport system permease protein
LQPAILSQWSAQNSIIHRVDARVKLAILLSFILSIALLRHPLPSQLLVGAIALAVTALLCRLPLRGLLARSFLIVPFVGPFALILFASGDHQRAWEVLSKSYLSASAVFLTVATTPFPKLLSAAKWFRIPTALVEVTQLIYRYLFVLALQAQQMRTAFQARNGSVGKRAFLAAAGTVAILFGRAYERAVFTHQAMLARGFEGTLPQDPFRSLRWLDLAVVLLGVAFSVALHFVAA